MSIGELFDRAFTVYAKNVIPFSSLLIVVIAPVFAINYFGSKDFFSAYVSVMAHTIQAGPKGPPPDITALAAHMPKLTPLLGAAYFLTFLALPLANAAVVVGVSRAYLGQPIRFADCYITALRRFLHVLMLAVMWIVALVATSLGLAIVFALVIFAGTQLFAHAKVAASIGAVLGMLGLFVAFIAAAIVVGMAAAFSIVSTVIERTDPVHAFGLGVARALGGGQFWRTTVVGLSLFGMLIAMDFVVVAVGGLGYFATRSFLYYFAVAALGSLFFNAFGYIAVAVYYYDIRVRREGLDLQLLADQIASRPAGALLAP
ncbi:MAG: hypothetical protein M3T49_09095 [Candidatus Eremiobacteraeota bacterium]|nr:hypothetical protein [Candidatus Eremiobacteraeota bacterium]